MKKETVPTNGNKTERLPDQKCHEIIRQTYRPNESGEGQDSARTVQGQFKAVQGQRATL